MKQIHVIPIGGEEPMHLCHASCFCVPLEDADKLMIHHAKDLRESRERSGINRPDEQWVLVKAWQATLKEDSE
jgi:hypothetical protein